MPSAGLLHQAAAIPVRNGLIGLVTTRRGKRWVVPKGCMEVGKTAGEVALMEAWEEAGVVGLLQPDPIGSYVYEKDNLTCHVLVFVLIVTDVVDTYPESGLRERAWVSLSQALVRVDDPGLRELIRGAVVLKAG